MNEKDSERVEQCRQEVDESLRDLQSAHSEMADMLNGMTAEGALLATDIGSAVRGLQFQDRTSQRIAPCCLGSGHPMHTAQNPRWSCGPRSQQQPMMDSAPTPCRKSAKSLASAKRKRLPEMWNCFDRGHDPTPGVCRS